MTPASMRLLGNTLLALAFVLLLVNIAGMIGWITKPAPSRSVTMVSLVLIVAASAFRRRARVPRG